MLTRWLAPAFVVLAAFLSGRMTAPEADTPTTPAGRVAMTEPPHGAEVPDCGAERRKASEERERLRTAIEAVRMELRMKEAARVEYQGPVQPWTDDVDPRLKPDAFSATMREAVDEVGIYADLELKCDEFPCLVALTMDEEAASDVAGFNLWPLLDALEERGLTLSYNIKSSSGPPTHAIFALHPPGASDELEKRTSFRLERFLDEREEHLKESAR